MRTRGQQFGSPRCHFEIAPGSNADPNPGPMRSMGRVHPPPREKAVPMDRSGVAPVAVRPPYAGVAKPGRSTRQTTIARRRSVRKWMGCLW